jgi:hypothetical protein
MTEGQVPLGGMFYGYAMRRFLALLFAVLA